MAGVFLTIVLATTCAAQEEYPWGYSNEEAGAFMGFALVTCGIVVLAWFVIWILVGIWVYKDAEKRGKSGALWLIIVILLGIIGIIIWLVVRGEKSSSSRHCPNCGREIPQDARSCPYCNKKFEE